MSSLLTKNYRNKWENQYIKKKNRKRGLGKGERRFRKNNGCSSNLLKISSNTLKSYRNTKIKHDRSKRMVNMKYHKDICINLVCHDDINIGNNNIIDDYLIDDMISIKYNLISVWICSQCTYRNVERKIHCKICNFPYNQTTATATKIINSKMHNDDISMIKLQDYILSNDNDLLFDDYYYYNNKTNDDDDEMLNIGVESKSCKEKKIIDKKKNKMNKNDKNKELTVSTNKHSTGFEAYIKYKNRDKINTEYGSISPYIEYLICYLRPILPTKKAITKLIKSYDDKAQIKIECILNQEYIKRFYDNLANNNNNYIKYCLSVDLKNISNNVICNDKKFDFYIVHSLSIPKAYYNEKYFYSQKSTYMDDHEIVRCFGQNLLVYGYIRRLYMEYYGFKWIIPNEINIICLDYYNHNISPHIKNHRKHPQYTPYNDKITYVGKQGRTIRKNRTNIEAINCHNIQNSFKNIEWQYGILKTVIHKNRHKGTYTYSYYKYHYQYINLIMWPKDRYFSHYPMNIPYYYILPIYEIGIKKGKRYLDDVIEIDKWLITRK